MMTLTATVTPEVHDLLLKIAEKENVGYGTVLDKKYSVIDTIGREKEPETKTVRVYDADGNEYWFSRGE